MERNLKRRDRVRDRGKRSGSSEEKQNEKCNSVIVMHARRQYSGVASTTCGNEWFVMCSVYLIFIGDLDVE